MPKVPITQNELDAERRELHAELAHLCSKIADYRLIMENENAFEIHRKWAERRYLLFSKRYFLFLEQHGRKLRS